MHYYSIATTFFLSGKIGGNLLRGWELEDIPFPSVRKTDSRSLLMTFIVNQSFSTAEVINSFERTSNEPNMIITLIMPSTLTLLLSTLNSIIIQYKVL